jgi:hypothetical protein
VRHPGWNQQAEYRFNGEAAGGGDPFPAGNDNMAALFFPDYRRMQDAIPADALHEIIIRSLFRERAEAVGPVGRIDGMNRYGSKVWGVLHLFGAGLPEEEIDVIMAGTLTASRP